MARGIIEGTSSRVRFPYGWDEPVSRAVTGSDIAKNDAVIVSKHSWDQRNTKLNGPDVAPPASPTDVAVNYAGNIIAVTTSTAPYLTLYTVSDGSLVKGEALTTQPAGASYSCCFSPNSTYLAVSNIKVSTSGATTVYKYTGGSQIYTKLPDLPIPWGRLNALAFSPDGNYLVGVSYSSPYYITVYKRTGDTFSLLANPITFGYDVESVAWSADGKYLAVSSAVYANALVRVYKFENEVLTSVYSNSSFKGYVSFSNNGRYLACSNGTDGMYLLLRTDDTFSLLKKIPRIDEDPYGFGNCQFSPDGAYLFSSYDKAPWVLRYKMNGANPQLLASLNTPPTTSGVCSLGGSGSGSCFVMSQTASPFLVAYTTSGTEDVSQLNNMLSYGMESLSTVDLIGVALDSGSVGQTIKVNLLSKLNEF